MKNISKMLMTCVAANGEPVALLIEPTEKGVSASIVGVTKDSAGVQKLGETVTMQSDWNCDLAVEGTFTEETLALLDQTCAEDFASVSGVL